MERIVEILAWPVTIIIIVAMLRSSLSKLVPTLKKLKYKDLELEFEKEANRILAEAERDLPEPPEEPKKEEKDSEPMFSRKQVEPSTQIIEAWRGLELLLHDLAKSKEIESGRSVKSLVNSLYSNGFITEEVMKVILELSALRNKVAHTDEEVITYKSSWAFKYSVNRVRQSLEIKNA